MLLPEESKEIAKQFPNYHIELNDKQKTNLYTYRFESSGRIINYILNSDKTITIVNIIR